MNHFWSAKSWLSRMQGCRKPARRRVQVDQVPCVMVKLEVLEPRVVQSSTNSMASTLVGSISASNQADANSGYRPKFYGSVSDSDPRKSPEDIGRQNAKYEDTISETADLIGKIIDLVSKKSKDEAADPNKSQNVKGTGGGNDIATGNKEDTVHAAGGNDNVFLGRGDDKAHGGEGHDTLTGAKGNDTLDGDAGNDSLAGGEGNDTLRGGSGDNVLAGGSGYDTYNFDGESRADLVDDPSADGEINLLHARAEEVSVRQRGKDLLIRVDQNGQLKSAILFQNYYASGDRTGWKVTTSNGEFNLEHRAKADPTLMAQMLKESYSNVDRLTPPPGYQLSEIMDDQKSGLNAVAFVSNDGKEVIVAIRGTEVTSLKDLKSDLGFGRGQGKAMTERLDAFLQANPNIRKVTMTGHSLGHLVEQRASAVLAPKYIGQVDFVAFGIGGPGAAQRIEQFKHALPENLKIINYVHESDPIWRFGDHHAETEFHVIRGTEGLTPLNMFDQHRSSAYLNYLQEHQGMLPAIPTMQELLDMKYPITLPFSDVDIPALQDEVIEYRLELPDILKKFDMGPSGSAVKPGFTAVDPSLRYSPERGFGFIGAVNGVDRGRADDDERDFVSAEQIEFLVDLKPGYYDVTLTIGDPGEVRQEMQIGINGFFQEKLTTYPGQIVRQTFRTYMLDSQMRISLTDVSAKTSAAVLNGVEITRVDPLAAPTENAAVEQNPVLVVLTHGWTKPDWAFTASKVVSIVQDVVHVVTDFTAMVASAKGGDYIRAINKASEVYDGIKSIHNKLSTDETHVSDWVFQAARDISASVRQQGLGSLDPNVVPINLPDIGQARGDKLLAKWQGSHDFLAVDWTDESNDGAGLFNFNEKEHRQAVNQVASAIRFLIEARVNELLKTDPNMKLDILFVGHSFGATATREAVLKLNNSPIVDKLDYVEVVTLDPVAMKPDNDPNEKAKRHDSFYWYHPEGAKTAFVDRVVNYYQDKGLAPTSLIEKRVITGKPLDDHDGGGVLGFTNRQARVWSVASGEEELRIRHLQEDTGNISSGQLRDILYTNDGEWLVSVGDDRQIKVRSADSGDEWLSIGGHLGAITDAALTPDSKHVVTVSGDRTVQVTRLSDGEIIATAFHKDATRVAVSGDGKYIATAGKDDEVRIWTIATVKGRPTLELHQSLRGHDKNLLGMTFDDTTGTLVIGGRDQKLQAWRNSGGKFVTVGEQWLGDTVKRIVAHDGLIYAASGSTVSIWKIENNRLTMTGQLHDHVADVNALSISADGQRLATGGADKTIFIYDLATMQKAGVVNSAMLPIRNLALSPDGLSVAATYVDQKGGPVNDINVTDQVEDRLDLGWFDLMADTKRHTEVPFTYLANYVQKGGEKFFALRDNPHALRANDVEWSHTRRDDPGSDQAGTIDSNITNANPVEVGVRPQDVTTSRPVAINLGPVFQDQDNAGLKYTVTSSNPGAVKVAIYEDDGAYQAIITPTKVGAATVTLTATDGSNIATTSLTVQTTDDSRAKLAELKAQARQLFKEVKAAERRVDDAKEDFRKAIQLAKTADELRQDRKHRAANNKLEQATRLTTSAEAKLVRSRDDAHRFHDELNLLLTSAHDLREKKLITNFGLKKFENNLLREINRHNHALSADVSRLETLQGRANAWIARARS